MENPQAYLHKVRKCIESCVTLEQLECMKPFVLKYWNEMQFVGFQGFVAIELKDFYNQKLKKLKNEN